MVSLFFFLKSYIRTSFSAYRLQWCWFNLHPKRPSRKRPRSTDYLDSGATTAKAGVLIDLPRINYDANGENGSLCVRADRVSSYCSIVEYFDGGME